MAKQILQGALAQEKLLTGINAVADAVKTTIGPRGRNVVYDRGYGAPMITNDGVSIAREITLADKFENMGAEIIKDVANKTNDAAGDGTTTATVLMQAIAIEGMRRATDGVNGLLLRRGIEVAMMDVVAELRAMAKPIKNKDEIKQVATISAESEEIGGIIAATINKVGPNGVVTVEESQVFGVTSDVVEGMEFDKGYVSPYMVTNQDRMEAVYANAPILITDKKIAAISEILPLLEKLAGSGKKELIIIAEEIEGEALATFLLNKIRGMFSVLAIKAPGFADRKRESLLDIAAVVGATLITGDMAMSLENAELSMLGRAGKVISTKDRTIIVDGKGKKGAIELRVKAAQALLAGAAKYDKEHLMKRIAKLTAGVAVIKVGAASETEMRYLKLKIEDAVNATKAAIEEGIVPGGGVALAKVAQKLEKKVHAPKHTEIRSGYETLVLALTAPLRQIAINAGTLDVEKVLQKVAKGAASMGYDAANDSFDGKIELVDMYKCGIIDPVKVTRTALQNAASAAGILLTTDVAIADDPETKKVEPVQ